MNDTGSLVVYGANGATGRRLVALAVAAGITPVVAGRRREALLAIAEPHGLEVRVGALGDAELDAVLAGAAVVVSCAGPYVRYGMPVADAALRAGAHYVDFSGEARWVHSLLTDRVDAAKAAGVVLVPSVGLGVCADLAAQRATRGLSDVRRLLVGYRIVGMRPSGATIRSTVEIFDAGSPVVGADGTVRFVPAGRRLHRLPGGHGSTFATPDPLLLHGIWPDAHIECTMQHPRPLWPFLVAAGALAGHERINRLLERLVRHVTPERTGGGYATAVVLAEGPAGSRAARATVGDTYEATARAGLAAVRGLLDGRGVPGVRSWGQVAGDLDEAAQAVGATVQDVTVGDAAPRLRARARIRRPPAGFGR